MKKVLPYILIALVLVAAALLIFTGKNERKRVLDERLSFRRVDKIPYGTYVAYENLSSLFPNATRAINKNGPGNWDSLSHYDGEQALIIISPMFFADEFEMKKIIRFAENGNDVFISTALVSEPVKTIMNCSVSYLDIFNPFFRNLDRDDDDTLVVSLGNPPFKRTYNYIYPGKKLDCHFSKLDTTIATVLGRDREGEPNFVHLKAGKGNIYFHLAPMTFSNYFLLRDRNMGYYEDALSVISPSTKKVVWDEYYLTKRDTYSSTSSSEGDSRGWLNILWEYPEFRWALLILLSILLLYVLLEMRRKQRYIPVITKPRNESLDFVKTIGRLYFDKGDHKNLCRKMASYFLEHVRTRYKMPTNRLDEQFVRTLQFKTGVDEVELRKIVDFILTFEVMIVTDQHLAGFHRQLESFYSKA